MVLTIDGVEDETDKVGDLPRLLARVCAQSPCVACVHAFVQVAAEVVEAGHVVAP